ncbi:hypothetical protein PLEOSDRAFT_1078905 [Pleurotus ostreatus PC15]|uniref:Uncharacterized protein n=1 Tax=Pleurotus ostreatus (strain PC15) TaxID=1137138 RepID=A0A067NDC5_PLEO1|nr:hypothetical protein PLEOSDRAFT_1078905 [Pleurotus ostreatus PC15]
MCISVFCDPFFWQLRTQNAGVEIEHTNGPQVTNAFYQKPCTVVVAPLTGQGEQSLAAHEATRFLR